MPVNFTQLRSEIETLQQERRAQYSTRKSMAEAIRRRVVSDSGLPNGSVLLVEPPPSKAGATLPTSDSFNLTLMLSGVVDKGFETKVRIEDPQEPAVDWREQTVAHVIRCGDTSFEIEKGTEDLETASYDGCFRMSEMIQGKAQKHFRDQALAKEGLLDPPRHDEDLSGFSGDEPDFDDIGVAY